MNVANKKMKHYNDDAINETNKFNLNDCVDIRIHTIDRTNIDAKLLPCLTVGEIETAAGVEFREF